MQYLTTYVVFFKKPNYIFTSDKCLGWKLHTSFWQDEEV